MLNFPYIILQKLITEEYKLHEEEMQFCGLHNSYMSENTHLSENKFHTDFSRGKYISLKQNFLLQ